MTQERLSLEYDADRHCVNFVFTSFAGTSTETVWLRDGLMLDDVCHALVVIPSVSEVNGDFLLPHFCDGRALCRVVSAMLDYFESSGKPRPELLAVRSAVRNYLAPKDEKALPDLFSCAFLDVMLRDAIIEEATCLDDVWSKQRDIVISIERHRTSLIDSLIGQPLTTAKPVARMASNLPSRDQANSQNMATG
jgi:hypothetical protein